MALTKIRRMNKKWRHEQRRRQRRERIKQSNLRWEREQKLELDRRRKEREDAKVKDAAVVEAQTEVG